MKKLTGEPAIAHLEIIYNLLLDFNPILGLGDIFTLTQTRSGWIATIFTRSIEISIILDRANRNRRLTSAAVGFSTDTVIRDGLPGFFRAKNESELADLIIDLVANIYNKILVSKSQVETTNQVWEVKNTWEKALKSR